MTDPAFRRELRAVGPSRPVLLACIPGSALASPYRELATCISLQEAQITAFTVAFPGGGKGSWYGWNDKNESKWNPLKDNEKPQSLPLMPDTEVH